MKRNLAAGWLITYAVLASCSSISRTPASAPIDAEPETSISGRQAYAELSRYKVALDDSHQRFLDIQISEIGVIHTDESELSSWKFKCIHRQAAEIHSALKALDGPSRKEFEALHVEGVDFLLADLSEHPEASTHPTLRLMWWEAGQGRGVTVRSVYDPGNPVPEQRCRILGARAFEKLLHQVR